VEGRYVVCKVYAVGARGGMLLVVYTFDCIVVGVVVGVDIVVGVVLVNLFSCRCLCCVVRMLLLMLLSCCCGRTRTYFTYAHNSQHIQQFHTTHNSQTKHN